MMLISEVYDSETESIMPSPKRATSLSKYQALTEFPGIKVTLHFEFSVGNLKVVYDKQ